MAKGDNYGWLISYDSTLFKGKRNRSDRNIMRTKSEAQSFLKRITSYGTLRTKRPRVVKATKQEYSEWVRRRG